MDDDLKTLQFETTDAGTVVVFATDPELDESDLLMLLRAVREL